MGRAPCCDKANVKKGPWSPEEDATLKCYLETHGTGGNWITLPQKAGLKRCGKSCRLRWLNYLRPNIKHGGFTEEEDDIICALYSQMGSRWSLIASQLPGRTDNDVKNYWNTKLKKKHQAGKTSLSVKSAANNIVPINGNDPTLACKSPSLQYRDPEVVANSVAFSYNSLTRTSVTWPALPDNIDYEPISSQSSTLSPFQFSLPGIILSEFVTGTMTSPSVSLPEEASTVSDLSFAMDTKSLSLPSICGLEDVGMLTDSLNDYARDASNVCQLQDKPNEVALSCNFAELGYFRTQGLDEAVTKKPTYAARYQGGMELD